MSNVASLEISSFTIEDTKYPYELAKHVGINKGDLNSEFANHAETFAFYATAYELAKAYQEQCKTVLEREYALADIQLRGQAKEGGAKLTEKSIENMVILQDSFQTAKASYEAAALNTGLLKAAVSAMEAKKDMLISLGAMMRAEGDSTISINKKLDAAKKVMAGHL